jgi:alanine racemase
MTTSTMPRFRPTRAEVNLDTLEANLRALITNAKTSSQARMTALAVKADGYGHGAVEVSRSALAAGIDWLCVALVEEAIELRNAGITAPILLLSEPPIGAEDAVVEHQIMVTVYTAGCVSRLAAAARSTPTAARASVSLHLKVDTGMHRIGAQPSEIVGLAQQIVSAEGVQLSGFCTHFAVADAVDPSYTEGQIQKFISARDSVVAAGIDPGVVHAANSAGSMFHPDARFDLARFGVSGYGFTPDPARDPSAVGVTLRPTLRLVSAVSFVKQLPAGERVSYGLAYELKTPSVIATVPIGYADGMSRRLFAVGAEVLIGGRRRPLAGRVTMDQILVDCGPVGTPEADSVVHGDEVVLLGTQGDETVDAWEWASKLDTIAYEVTCALTKRVPRIYVRDAHG